MQERFYFNDKLLNLSDEQLLMSLLPEYKDCDPLDLYDKLKIFDAHERKILIERAKKIFSGYLKELKDFICPLYRRNKYKVDLMSQIYTIIIPAFSHINVPISIITQLSILIARYGLENLCERNGIYE